MASLNGTVSLQGALSTSSGLSGGISTVTKSEEYAGDYQVTPQAYSGQVLETANKLLTQNVTVAAVPYYEVSNLSDGKTVYIASEV